MSNEDTWNRLVARVGDTPGTDAALLAALGAYQKRTGCLPGGFDSEEWEDVYGDAMANYQTTKGN